MHITQSCADYACVHNGIIKLTSEYAKREQKYSETFIFVRDCLIFDNSYFVILSQILGHSDINVTETYLRVDIEQLRLCSLDLEVLQ